MTLAEQLLAAVTETKALKIENQRLRDDVARLQVPKTEAAPVKADPDKSGGKDEKPQNAALTGLAAVEDLYRKKYDRA